MDKANRHFTWMHLVESKSWVTERIHFLESRVAPINLTCFVGCAAANVNHAVAAYVCICVIAAMGASQPAPPAILKPGSLRHLHPRDAALCRAARVAHLGLWSMTKRAPAFIVSWFALGGLVIAG
jgi:hypothetical protein